MATFLDAMTQELTQSNKDLKDMAERAKAANRAKSDFLSNMSHEIRTPINAILGMDEMILREATDETIREYFKAGFDDYMTKPIDSRQLEQCLIKYLPPEKVKYQDNVPAQEVGEVSLPEWLLSVPGLDTESGIKHCGSVEAYLSALTVFAESLPGVADEIQRFFANRECDNYTTKVHALKSTARVAGLNELSERARRLEDAGNNGYLDELIADTPVLLALCKDYAKALAPLTEKSEPDEENKAEISDVELKEAWETIGDIIQTFDYDNLMYLLGELAGYRLEEKDRQKLQLLQEAAQVPDWERLKELIK